MHGTAGYGAPGWAHPRSLQAPTDTEGPAGLAWSVESLPSLVRGTALGERIAFFLFLAVYSLFHLRLWPVLGEVP